MSKTVRLNVDDPATLKRLTENGSIWQFTQFWQKAIDAINRGEIDPAACKDMPAQARAALKEGS